ncbi:hypothetical protein EMCRGX_G028616 [Ephydatia muelleri]
MLHPRVDVRSALVVLLSITHCVRRCSSQSPFYDDGGSIRTLCACDNWCQENWDSNRILRYNFTYSRRTVMKSVSVVENGYDCTKAKTSQDCVPTSMVRSTVQIPVSVESWNRTGPIIETTSQELSLGFLRTDNIGITIPQTEQGSCRFVVYFNEFDIERSSNCEKDYFSVQTTKSQGDIPKYCKTLSRIEVQNRKKLQLWMHSDNTASSKGIHAVYCFSHWPATSNNLPCSCGSGSTRKRRGIYESSDAQVHRPHPPNTQHEEEDNEIHLWLKDMLKHGEDRVSLYLNSSDRRQQHIAQRLVEAMGSQLQKQPTIN